MSPGINTIRAQRLGSNQKASLTAEQDSPDLESGRLGAAFRTPWFPLAGTVLAFLLLASALQFEILGFQLTGWAWLAGLAAAVLTFARAHHSPALPIFLWTPWVLLAAGYSFAGFPNAYQSAAQTICPVLVGLAASTLRPRRSELQLFVRFLRWAALAFVTVLLFLRFPMLLLGRLPEVTGLAPEAISSLMFQSLFLCSYLAGRKRVDFLLYLGMAMVPVITVTRGPILGSLAILILTFAPLRATYRIGLLLAAVISGLLVFQTDRIQRKMFHSGSGTLADLRWDNPDLITSGREPMWRTLWDGISKKPWFGHGGNADAAELIRKGFPLYLPHNDWLRVLFNYGAVGCGLYALTMIGQIGHGLRRAREAPPEARLLFHASLSAFVPYMVLMMTDNILIYAQFFGNLHFLLLGLAYGGWAAAREAGSESAEPVDPTHTEMGSQVLERKIPVRRCDSVTVRRWGGRTVGCIIER